MSSRRRLIVALVLLLLGAACAHPPKRGDGGAAPTSGSAAPNTVRAELEARGRAYSAAVVRASASGWAALQVDSLAAFYTDGGIVFPPRGEPIRGRDDVRQYWTRSPDRKILSHTITIERVDVGESADLAADHGRVQVTTQQGGDSAINHRLTYISVWRREPDGVWRKHLDSFW